jgi:hypothetical protein
MRRRNSALGENRAHGIKKSLEGQILRDQESEMHDRRTSRDEEQMVETNDYVSPLILSGSIMSVGPSARRRNIGAVMALCATVCLMTMNTFHWVATLASHAPRG